MRVAVAFAVLLILLMQHLGVFPRVLVAGRGGTENGSGAEEDRGGFHGEWGPPSYRPKPLAQMTIPPLPSASPSLPPSWIKAASTICADDLPGERFPHTIKQLSLL